MPWYNPEDPKQRNAGLAGVLLLASIYLYNMFYHGDQVASLTLLQDSLETLEAENLRAQVLAARGGGQIEETMAEYERQVSKLEELIPAGEDVAGVLQDVQVEARLANVRVDQWTPEIPESVGIYEMRAVAMSAVATFVVNCVELTKVVGRGEPSHSTTLVATKSEPVTVKATSAPPAMVVFGVRVVRTGSGLSIVKA